ncbi:class I SAM-dependent methyltransferase [Rhizorhabdus sp.]|uniref:class I SAM-dependent methyltransferase n=1 Tax=Rhizorhabdus sp. TaxID=1968843 RepID=UPI001B413B27|nr:methyltransferase [Rhizorhabdus sp.]MBP8231880.1 class I SAM-dependent methyltransferase [Rhizorhabdus sp.]
MRYSLLVALGLSLAAPSLAVAAPAPSPELTKALSDSRRSEANRARDAYRHPAETLAFFEVAPGQTVVEYYPGGGWYTEILAPMLKGNGRYVAMPPASEKGLAAAKAMLERNKDWFGTVDVAPFSPTEPSTFPAGTADRVLTFRNVHNLIMAGDATAAKAFADFYGALKPGGILGVVDHRLPEEMDSAKEKQSGYIKRSTIIRLATAAGFKLVGESPVNANPKDTHDWPKGVWTLPPTYSLGEVDRAKYQAIGESDRLTLKFVKPAS